MMGKHDDEIALLRLQHRRKQEEMYQAQNDQNTLASKIERLVEAKRQLHPIQHEFFVMKHDMDRKAEKEDKWKGDKYTDYEADLSIFLENYRTYYNGLDYLYDNICDEITRLENESNETGGIIGWLQNSLNSLENEVEKLIHF